MWGRHFSVIASFFPPLDLFSFSLFPWQREQVHQNGRWEVAHTHFYQFAPHVQNIFDGPFQVLLIMFSVIAADSRAGRWQENPETLEVMSRNEMDRGVLQLYLGGSNNKGRVHRADARRVFCLGVLEGTASFYPELPAACCSLPFPAGWGTGKAQPSRTPYHIFPVEPTILPQCSETQAVQTLVRLWAEPAAQS